MKLKFTHPLIEIDENELIEFIKSKLSAEELEALQDLETVDTDMLDDISYIGDGIWEIHFSPN